MIQLLDHHHMEPNRYPGCAISLCHLQALASQVGTLFCSIMFVLLLKGPCTFDLGKLVGSYYKLKWHGSSQ
jgi:hypothetical protein